MHLRKNGWKRRNEKYQRANFWKFQWKNSAKESYDVNLIAECYEYFGNKKKTRRDCINKKELELVVESTGFRKCSWAFKINFYSKT